MAELISLEAEGLRQDEAVLVAFFRGYHVAERGVRRAYKSYFDRRRRHFEKDDLEVATDRATVALLRHDLGRRLRDITKDLWAAKREAVGTRMLRRTLWVDEFLRKAIAEPLAIDTGRSAGPVGMLLSLLQEAASGELPGNQILETMRGSSAYEILELLRWNRLLERTQHASFEEMVEVARQLREESEWEEGRDLLRTLLRAVEEAPAQSPTTSDLLMATVGLPSLLVARLLGPILPDR